MTRSWLYVACTVVVTGAAPALLALAAQVADAAQTITAGALSPAGRPLKSGTSG